MMLSVYEISTNASVNDMTFPLHDPHSSPPQHVTLKCHKETCQFFPLCGNINKKLVSQMVKDVGGFHLPTYGFKNVGYFKGWSLEAQIIQGGMNHWTVNVIASATIYFKK